MNPIIEAMPQLAAYQPALLALAILCLVAPIQSFLSAPLAFIKEEQVPGMPLRGDHKLLSFRVLRTYSNTVENLPAFGLALLLAIVAGAGAALVNWLAIIHVALRLVFWAVYYSGVGKVAGGPRTISYVGALFANLALAVAAIWALI